MHALPTSLRPVWFAFVLGLFAAASGCQKQECVISYPVQFYEPIQTSWQEIKDSIGSETARDIRNPGKIFAFGTYLFINEVGEGVHVIDNSDPANPQNIHFIRIPGSLDIAVSEGKLYSDNYSDLIVLDISDLGNAAEISRVENVFYSNSFGFWFDYTSDSVITGWRAVETVYEYDCDDQIYFFDDVLFDGGMIDMAGGPVAFSEAAASDIVGKAGSMARFSLYNGKMYALNNYELLVFDAIGELSLQNSVDIEWGVETLFPYGERMFIGAQNGMHIMDISNAVQPEYISSYTHITTCDPVVVSGDLAFVTLRSGNECQGFTNQLDIIDLSNIYAPVLLTSYPMTNPHGLGIGGAHNLLYLCDGDDGLRIFNKDDVMDLQQIEHYSSIHAFDVIPYGNLLFMIGNDGFYQYDCSDLEDIHLISTIPVVP